jgi:thymidylate kinase
MNIGSLGSSAAFPIELSSDDEEYPVTPIRLKTGGLTPQDASPLRPSIISIEGIPGSGKSSIMTLLAERFKDSPDVLVLREPTSIWEEIKQDDGTSLTDLYFRDQSRYGLTFQLAYFLAIERQLRRALRDHQNKRVIICERSLLSARTVYHEMLPVKNRVKYDIYQTLFQKEGLGNVYPDHIILLDTEPRECAGRTSRKDWRGEEIITLEYLQRCRRQIGRASCRERV